MNFINFMSFITVAAFVLGLIMGSFINVLVIRLNTGKTLGGRSFCVSCSHKLAWYDLVPLLSYIVLLGKCRYCKSAISMQYPIVEFATGVAFALAALRFVPSYNAFNLATVIQLLLLAIILAIFVAITVYDLRHKIIPDVLVYPLIVLSLIFSIWQGTIVSVFSRDALFGPVAFAVFAALWFLSGGKWMGFGDAKLVLALGFLLGFELGLSAMLLAFWGGAIFGIIMLFMSRGSVTIKTEIPFAPFLIFATLVQILCPISIITM